MFKKNLCKKLCLKNIVYVVFKNSEWLFTTSYWLIIFCIYKSKLQIILLEVKKITFNFIHI